MCLFYKRNKCNNLDMKGVDRFISACVYSCCSEISKGLKKATKRACRKK